MNTVRTFKKMKESGEKIVMLTAYDYPSAKFTEAAGIDIILVGDSLGMVVQGYHDTLQVTMDDMIYHTRATRRGAPNSFIAGDMPFMSYHLNIDETKKNAARFIVEGGANAVKLEGGKPSRLEAIKAIRDCEIPVIAHLGLTPQSIHSLGGYAIQGKTKSDFDLLKEQALAVQEAGAFLLVLEGIPEQLGKEITESLSIPTIGIGAGRYTDGQVLVYHDILGMSDIEPKFLKVYARLSESIPQSIKEFYDDVKKGRFPAEEHIYKPIK
ncbi:MAG: 3-methyl-2-oxobutanoate hydroxymethyltransferase [Candidatus Cloacimonadales bacterium]|nr:3-methyl-2-oxobutanoate hydroxymethyltransferase [Candidatus Cloacimonadales bacterium]